VNAAYAKETVRDWVRANASAWPGFRAAHLVGGITTMPEDEPFPAHKDADVHLIFAEGSPLLTPTGPWLDPLAAIADGVAIEAGLKSIAEYRSPEAVLVNPEIAHHLTVESVLYDPDGMLARLQSVVSREYARRRWVLARLEHERRGLAGALALRALAAAEYGAAAEANLLGYTMTFGAAALWVAALQPPRLGGRVFVRQREFLAKRDRLDLHEEVLALLGVRHLSPARVEELLAEAAEAFDRALEIKRDRGTRRPFQHKLHAHLRPYLIGSCRVMLDEGYHREAACWLTAIHLASTDVILTDGPEEERPSFAARQAALLRELGLETAAAREARFAEAARLSERIFALAEEIAGRHPEILD
jgi:hypothetical protein